MKTYLQMDGDQLVEYVEKREYDLLAQERADFGALVDKLERELNAAKAENEAMKEVIKATHKSLFYVSPVFGRTRAQDAVLVKLQPFLKP
jgi:hypothetical protein